MPGVEQERGTPLWYVKTRKTDTQRQVDDECAFTSQNSAVAGCTTWGSNQIQRQDNTRHVFQGVMSYVTGSHSFKFGYNHEIGPDGRMGNTHNGDLYQNYTAGQPSSVDVWNTPQEAPGIVDYDSGLFMQDTWTFKRLTLNPGPAHRVVQRRHEGRFGAGRPVRPGPVLPGRARTAEVGTGLRAALRARSTTCSATAGRR